MTRKTFRHCKETDKFIPLDEWLMKYGDRANDHNFIIMADIKPYTSMIDGSVINSRSQHRAHLKAHGCIEVGNDSSLHKQRKPVAPPPGLRETLIRAVDKQMRKK